MSPTPRSVSSSGRRRALVAACALAAVWTLAPTTGSDAPAGRLEAVSGQVEIGRQQPPAWAPAHAGDALAPGDIVRTGEDGRAEVSLDGSRVRLYPNSLLRLPLAFEAGSGAREVHLDGGHSLFDVLQGRPDDRFEVRTPEAVVSVKGTRFGVALDGSRVSVSVFRGRVGVRGRAPVADELVVQTGFAAVRDGERPFELLRIGPLDPWDGWSRGEPAPQILSGQAPAAPAMPKTRGTTPARKAASRDAASIDVLEPLRAKPGLVRSRFGAPAGPEPGGGATPALTGRADGDVAGVESSLPPPSWDPVHDDPVTAQPGLEAIQERAAQTKMGGTGLGASLPSTGDSTGSSP